MSSAALPPASSALPEAPSDSEAGRGSTLVDLVEGMAWRRQPSRPLGPFVPLSARDWAVSLGFFLGGIGYLAGVAWGLHWVWRCLVAG
jgi:hypothetical protein